MNIPERTGARADSRLEVREGMRIGAGLVIVVMG